MADSVARSFSEEAERIAQPAPPPVDRQRLIGAMVDLCEAGQGRASAEAQALIDDIFLDLIKRAERDIRLRLADRLADAAWAPSSLINALALDDIEIARPIIARSPVLQDSQLVRLLVTATIEHQIEVARRPGLSAQVVKAIIDRNDPVVLTTLAGNETASVSDLAMSRLVEASRKIAALRAPLSRHPRLSMELACVLYSWVGETLKGELTRRFRIDAAALDKALAEATAGALSAAPAPDWRAIGQGDEDRREMEERLVAKLEAADQLRPGFLLRALREGKLYMFQVALASLAGLKIEDVGRAMHSDRPELLALACAAVGIDRSVFPTILSLVRALNDDKPGESAEALQSLNAAFSPKGEGEAVKAFLDGMAALNRA
jgi:uncharacterized protein (DUF2336 family)